MKIRIQHQDVYQWAILFNDRTRVNHGNDCIQGDRGQIMAILFNDHTKANHGYSI